MSVVPAFARLAAPLATLLLAALMAALAPLPAAAQQEPEFFDTPFAPGQWNIGRRLDDSKLRYCIDKRDPDWQVAGDIADAIAGALLLAPERYVVDSEIVLEDITKVYGVMLEHCDLYMGFKLIPEGYPAWLTVTRAYYASQYVFVARDPALHALSDLPPGRPIGATIGTSAHIRLAAYLLALPAARRWQVFPFGNNDLTLTSLGNGTVDVALVWAPAFWAWQRQNPATAGFHVVAPAPLPPTVLGVGAILLAGQKFLRSAVDEAIAALLADGSIAGILKTYDFPATAAP